MFENTLRHAIERANQVIDNDGIIDQYNLGYLHALEAALQDLAIGNGGIGLYQVGNRNVTDWVHDIRDTIHRGLGITDPVA